MMENNLTAFKVWCEGDGDRKSAEVVNAYDPEDAARSFAESNHADWDYPSETEGIHVISPDGTETVWTVTAEPDVRFWASEAAKDES